MYQRLGVLHSINNNPYPPRFTSTHCVDYRGDNQEKEEFESNGTSTTTHSADGYPFTINQETECKPD